MFSSPGNKIDLERNRNVTVEQAEEYAKSVGAKHVHTSAKLNRGIDELFLSLTKSWFNLNTTFFFKNNKSLIIE